MGASGRYWSSPAETTPNNRVPSSYPIYTALKRNRSGIRGAMSLASRGEGLAGGPVTRPSESSSLSRGTSVIECPGLMYVCSWKILPMTQQATVCVVTIYDRVTVQVAWQGLKELLCPGLEWAQATQSSDTKSTCFLFRNTGPSSHSCCRSWVQPSLAAAVAEPASFAAPHAPSMDRTHSHTQPGSLGPTTGGRSLHHLACLCTKKTNATFSTCNRKACS